MALDRYHFAERLGADYREGGPLLFTFHGTGGDENQFLDLAAQVFPEAAVIAPRGDVSEHGAARFFKRTGEGIYDMADLAERTQAMARFVAAHVERLQAMTVAGLGYSNGANILASVMLSAPGQFTHAVLMHPLIPWRIEPEAGLQDAAILVTAGGRDPICPPELTGQLIDGLESRGAAVKSAWHPGGHEVAQSELQAVASFFGDVRASLVDPLALEIEHAEQDGKGRYFIAGPGEAVAEMTYSRAGADTLIIDHTEVPDAFRGIGVGRRLLDRLLADARQSGVKIIPLCPFAAAQFAEHPEWEDMLAQKVRAGRR